MISYSLLLAYTLADLEESKQEHAACYTIYDGLIAHLYDKISKLEATIAEETTAALAELEASSAESEDVKREDNGDEDMDEGGAVEKREKKAEEEEKAKKEVRDKYEPEVARLKSMAASVWITEMRFARRADVSTTLLPHPVSVRKIHDLFATQGVKPARQVFTKARKSAHLTWQVVEASGEYLVPALRLTVMSLT